MRNCEIEDLEKQIMEQFEQSIWGQGEIENIKSRLHVLEQAVAHLTAFLAVHLKLSSEEIFNENGITDF